MTQQSKIFFWQCMSPLLIRSILIPETAHSWNRLNLWLGSLPELFSRSWIKTSGLHLQTDCYIYKLIATSTNWLPGYFLFPPHSQNAFLAHFCWFHLHPHPWHHSSSIISGWWCLRGSALSNSVASWFSSGLRGLLLWFGQSDRGGIEEVGSKVEMTCGRNPWLRRGLGQGAINMQSGKGRTGCLEGLRGTRMLLKHLWW